MSRKQTKFYYEIKVERGNCVGAIFEHEFPRKRPLWPGRTIITNYKRLKTKCEFANSALNDANKSATAEKTSNNGGADTDALETEHEMERRLAFLNARNRGASLEEAEEVKDKMEEVQKRERAEWQAVLELGDKIGDMRKAGVSKTSEEYKAAVAHLRLEKEKFKSDFGKDWKPMKKAKTSTKPAAPPSVASKRKAEDVVGTHAWAAKQRKNGDHRECLRVWKTGPEGEHLPVSLGEWRAANLQLGKAISQVILKLWYAEAKQDQKRFRILTSSFAGCMMKRWVGHTEGLDVEQKRALKDKDPYDRPGHIVMWFKDKASQAMMKEAIAAVTSQDREGKPLCLSTERPQQDARSSWVAIVDEEDWEGFGNKECFLLLLYAATAHGDYGDWVVYDSAVEKAYKGKAKTKIVVVVRAARDLELVLDRATMPLWFAHLPITLHKKEAGWEHKGEFAAEHTSKLVKETINLTTADDGEEEDANKTLTPTEEDMQT